MFTVNISPEEYVLLPTTTGARLHYAANLVQETSATDALDGTVIFRAVEKRVVSIIISLGRSRVSSHLAESFVAAAKSFAEPASHVVE